MIHYHGGPITPVDVAVKVWTGRHAFVSFNRTDQVDLAAEITQSFALDNGAFSMWTKGVTVEWDKYYAWIEDWSTHPGFDFAVIPDYIDGDEAANDSMIDEWPPELRKYGSPVWHLHESIDRFERMCHSWDRVCLGSSGEYSRPGSPSWWVRMYEALDRVCENGRPPCKLHGLRMLDRRVFSQLPLSSADSTNVARHHSEGGRGHAFVILNRIETENSIGRWTGSKGGEVQNDFLL